MELIPKTVQKGEGTISCSLVMKIRSPCFGFIASTREGSECGKIIRFRYLKTSGSNARASFSPKRNPDVSDLPNAEAWVFDWVVATLPTFQDPGFVVAPISSSPRVTRLRSWFPNQMLFDLGNSISISKEGFSRIHFPCRA